MEIYLPYLPTIKEATIDREVLFDNFKGVLLKDIETPQDDKDVQYYYIYIVYRFDSQSGEYEYEPFKCFASEWNKEEGEKYSYLCSFTEKPQEPHNINHINYGESKKWKNLDLFYNEVTSMVIKELILDTNISMNIIQPAIDETNIRSKEDIMEEYKISDDFLQIKYKSYLDSFAEHGLSNPNNIGMFDVDFNYPWQSLTADEVKKALYSYHQTIVNRVITALDFDATEIQQMSLKEKILFVLSLVKRVGLDDDKKHVGIIMKTIYYVKLFKDTWVITFSKERTYNWKEGSKI